MTLITLRRQRQMDLRVQSQHGLHSEVQDSQGYIGCLKKQKTKTKGTTCHFKSGVEHTASVGHTENE